jgi:probable rRNA maturation factor
MPITFSEADRRLKLSNRRKLKAFIHNELSQQEGIFIVDLSYVFCSDDYLLDMNKRFLNHDYYTDIITFDMGEGSTSKLTGEVYISVDRVQDNASRLEVTFNEELLRVIFHGVLHLCGYNDKTKSQEKEMRATEDKYLRLYSKFLS